MNRRPDLVQPPDKKRKTDKDAGVTDQLWEDDGMDDLPQDAWDNLDSFIASQQVTTGPAGDASSNYHNNNAVKPEPVSTHQAAPSRSIGRGTTKSLSASAMSSHQVTRKVLQKSASGILSGSSAASSGQHSHSGSPNVLKPALDQLQKENEKLKRELKDQQQSQYGKDGRLKILEDRLTQKDMELHKLRQEKKAAMDLKSNEKVEDRKQYDREIDRLQTQLQFKEQEIMEVQKKYVDMQKKLVASKQTGPNVYDQMVNVNRSPLSSKKQLEYNNSPKRSSFPTTQTFQADESSPAKQVENKTGSDIENLKINDYLFEISRWNTNCIQVIEEKNKTPVKLKMKLNLGNSKGLVSGPCLVYKMMQSQGMYRVAKEKPSTGAMSLLQKPPSPQNMNNISLERDPDTMLLSPVVTGKSGEVSPITEQSLESTTSSDIATRYHEDSTIFLQTIEKLLQNKTPDILQNKTHDPKTVANLLESNSECAVDLLPIIEGYIDRYISVMESVTDLSLSRTSPNKKGTPSSSETSMESLGSTVFNYISIGANYANSVEQQVLNMLKILKALVNYCAPVRDKLLEEIKPRSNSNVAEQMEGVQAGTSQPAGQPVATSTQKSSSQTQMCCILSKLCNLGNPSYFHTKPGNPNLCACSLDILTIVIESCSPDQLSLLGNLQLQETLLGCMCENLDTESKFRLGSCMLDALHAWVRSKSVIASLCTQEECLLLNVYHFCVQSISDLSKDKQRLIHSKLIMVLSTIMSIHKSCHGLGSTHIDCQCNEVVKTVVLVLQSELDGIDPKDQQGVDLLRQGTALLQLMSVADKKNFVEHRQDVAIEYVELICGMDRLYKTVTEDVHSLEKAALHDLWDFKDESPTEDDDQDDSPDTSHLSQDDPEPQPSSSRARSQADQNPSFSRSRDSPARVVPSRSRGSVDDSTSLTSVSASRHEGRLKKNRHRGLSLKNNEPMDVVTLD